ncbi:hypothetical protein PENSPDRAFT_352196 [Peniophora sp. CONT]|nr:hypothetical protein PENSPDRAFT_352196 [Peniophora sp. CONT]
MSARSSHIEPALQESPRRRPVHDPAHLRRASFRVASRPVAPLLSSLARLSYTDPDPFITFGQLSSSESLRLAQDGYPACSFRTDAFLRDEDQHVPALSTSGHVTDSMRFDSWSILVCVLTCHSKVDGRRDIGRHRRRVAHLRSVESAVALASHSGSRRRA